MSEFRSENKKMYSESVSLREMQSVMHEIADLKTPSQRWKDRVTAAASAVGFTWNRTKDFYYRNARSVKDHEGRQARSALRELRAKRQANEQLRKLQSTISYLRETDSEFYRPTIDQLEHTLSRSGLLDCSVDETERRE